MGVPALLREEEGAKAQVITRFRSRQIWTLLASLALDPDTCEVGQIATRLWPEVPHPDRNLRPLLTLLRKAVGHDTLIQERGLLRLAPNGLTTDWDEIHQAREGVRRETDPHQRAAILRAAAGQITGEFLQGCEVPTQGEGWLELMRLDAEALSSDIWHLLALALEESGDRRGAFEAARKAYSLRPDNPQVEEAVLRLADGKWERAGLERFAKRHGFQEVLLRLDALEKDGQPISVQEEQALRVALDVRMASLTALVQVKLHSLSVFPAAFTTQQARAICDTAATTLREFVRRQLLVSREGGRFALRGPIREELWGRLSEKERQRLLKRHSRFFYRLLGSAPRPNNHPDWIALFRREESNLRQVLDWYLSLPPSPDGVDFIAGLRQWWQAYPEGRIALARPYLEAAATSLDDALHAGYACQLRANLAIDIGDFKDALDWIERNGEIWKRRGYASEMFDWQTVYGQFLIAAHHGAEDAAFDTVAQRALEHVPTHEPPAFRKAYAAAIRFIVAENDMARGRYDQALEHNAQALAFRLEPDQPLENLPATWYQRAFVLLALRREDDAREAWNRALEGFESLGERHGIANCYEQLGLLSARQGQAGLALSLVKQAIRLYEELDAVPSRAAALGTLGEVYQLRGDTDQARSCFEEGLAFWTAKGHSRWIQRFKERLERLDEDAYQSTPG